MKSIFFLRYLISCILIQVTFALPNQASIVHDPTTAANVMAGVTTMSNLLKITNQVQGRLNDLNNSIGTAVGSVSNPLQVALQLFGRCGDPFAGLKSSFLGLGKISPNFDFCNLIEGQKAYTDLLFIPFEQIGGTLTHQKHRELLQARQQVLQQSSVNTLALAAQQKQGIQEMRQKVVDLSQKAISSSTLREDMRIGNQLLAIIAHELVNMRALMVNQAEVQASLAANQVPLSFNPVVGGP